MRMLSFRNWKWIRTYSSTPNEYGENGNCLPSDLDYSIYFHWPYCKKFGNMISVYMHDSFRFYFRICSCIIVFFSLFFIQRICSFCSFNKYPISKKPTELDGSLETSYRNSLVQEIHRLYGYERRYLASIYFGGGSPSLLSVGKKKGYRWWR
jgi:coproporphyrinogen III oxidase-like Fe-S oxidoreductase